MGAISAVDHYFETVFGMPIDGGGGVVRTELRLSAQPPFLLCCAAMELVRGGRTYRSVSPALGADATELPLEKLGRVEALRVFAAGPDWSAREDCRVVALDIAHKITGAARIPASGYGRGILENGVFVSWAFASQAGPVWNLSAETHPAHRRRGFAARCVHALAADLMSNGEAPLYLALNDASANTALAAGLLEYGLWRRVISVRRMN